MFVVERFLSLIDGPLLFVERFLSLIDGPLFVVERFLPLIESPLFVVERFLSLVGASLLSGKFFQPGFDFFYSPRLLLHRAGNHCADGLYGVRGRLQRGVHCARDLELRFHELDDQSLVLRHGRGQFADVLSQYLLPEGQGEVRVLSHLFQQFFYSAWPGHGVFPSPIPP